MSYFRHGDPLDDFNSLDLAQCRVRMKYPVCCYCDEKIKDGKMFDIEGNFYHIDCAKDEFVKLTRDYIEEDYY